MLVHNRFWTPFKVLKNSFAIESDKICIYRNKGHIFILAQNNLGWFLTAKEES